MQDRLRSRVRKRAGERGRWEGGEEISIKGGQTKGGKPDLRVSIMSSACIYCLLKEVHIHKKTAFTQYNMYRKG